MTMMGAIASADATHARTVELRVTGFLSQPLLRV
jgi:hypothetical protein